MSDCSTQGVTNFLDFAAQKGLMKKGSVVAIKTACNNIFSILDEAEASDVSKLDLEAVIQRYQNINSLKVRPDTMQAYGQRVKYAVSEFLRYNENQAGWKPSGGQRSANSSQTSRRGRASKNENPQPAASATPPESVDFDASQIMHQFPIRKDMVVTVKGIPYDVKRSEMARLNAYLANLVAEEEADDQIQPRLNPAPADVAAN